jgi:hypothetical protein
MAARRRRHGQRDHVAQAGRPTVGIGEAPRVWARMAALGFGGPAGQIEVMHRTLGGLIAGIQFLPPGVMATQFAGFIGAFRDPGALPPPLAGIVYRLMLGAGA